MAQDTQLSAAGAGRCDRDQRARMSIVSTPGPGAATVRVLETTSTGTGMMLCST